MVNRKNYFKIIVQTHLLYSKLKVCKINQLFKKKKCQFFFKRKFNTNVN